MAGPRQQAGGLRQQRRLADAGVAADQQHRAPDKTAAGDAIKLGHSGRKARGLVALAGQCFQRELTALASGADRGRHRGRAGVLFDQRVPLAAGFALALPTVMRRAAVLADKGKRVLGHAGMSRRQVACAAFHSMERPAASMIPSTASRNVSARRSRTSWFAWSYPRSRAVAT